MIIPQHWEIPNTIKARIGTSTYGRQRAIIEEGHLLLVLHRVPGPTDSERQGVLFWRTPEGEWKSSHGGNGVESLRGLIKEYSDAEQRLDKDHDNAKSALDLFKVLEWIVPLKRAAANLSHAIQAARTGLPSSPDLIESRDLAYEMNREVEILLEDTRNAVDYKMARDAEEQAESAQQALQASHRLNILAALFLPLTAIASVFGMNMSSGMKEESTLAFYLVLIASILLGFLIKAWVVRRKTPPANQDSTPP